MTAETDLLPLPEPVAVKYPDSGLRDDEHALRLWAAHGYDTGGEPLFSAEQLREATAPLQAEIEALRAEVNDYRENGVSAVRFAPSSAHWSAELRRLFGSDARDGIDRLEERLRAAEQGAARWRFIRRKLSLTGNGNGTCAMQAINLPANISGWPEPGKVVEFCEEAIDAALGQGQGGSDDA